MEASDCAAEAVLRFAVVEVGLAVSSVVILALMLHVARAPEGLRFRKFSEADIL